MAEQVYGNVTIKGFVIGPVVVNDYVLGVIKMPTTTMRCRSSAAEKNR